MVEQTHTWHDEWANAWMERCELENYSCQRSNYEAGGPMSIESVITFIPGPTDWKVDHGWPRKQAEAFTLIAGALRAPLAAATRDRSDPDPAVHARSDRYAASTRVICEALAQRAKQMTTPAPLIYRT